jgi:septal ring factor EnvC (AmiA/AmiB activator)
MRFVFVSVISLAVFLLSGCVTTSKYKTDMDRLQSKIEELEASVKEQESARASNQAQLEAALKKQSEIEQEFESTMNRLKSLSKKKSAQGSELKMPSAKEIQAALKGAGFYSGELDGVIGPATKEAIRKFQEANQLTPDGVVGSKTWAILEKYLEEK